MIRLKCCAFLSVTSRNLQFNNVKAWMSEACARYVILTFPMTVILFLHYCAVPSDLWIIPALNPRLALLNMTNVFSVIDSHRIRCTLCTIIPTKQINRTTNTARGSKATEQVFSPYQSTTFNIEICLASYTFFYWKLWLIDSSFHTPKKTVLRILS